MMRRLVPLLALLLIALPFTAPAQDGEPERVRIHGSNVLGHRVMPALVRAWLDEAGYGDLRTRRIDGRFEIHARREDGRVIVEIQTPGSAGAFAALIKGDAEIGMSARAPTAKELDDAWLVGRLRSPDQEYVVGLDGLALVVHPDNPLNALSREQLRLVFSGRVRDWSQLGGSAGAIRVIGLAADTGGHELLSALVLDGGRQAATTTVQPDSRAVAAAVAGDPRAIGYLPVGLEAAGVRTLAVSAGGEAVLPTRVNVMTEDYPLTRRLYLYGGQLMSALGRSLATFAISPGGQAVVARNGMLALTPRVLPAEPASGSPEEYAGMVAGARRLGTNLRFGKEYTVLDSRGTQDLERVIAYLREPANQHRELMLMAFAAPDARTPARALFLSQDRVDFVAELLGQAGVTVSRRRGFGGKVALAAGDDEHARFVNERIELWVR
jgi:phosphate transport system substrate-binding protein